MIQSDFTYSEQRRYERIIRGETPSVRVPVEIIMQAVKDSPALRESLDKEVLRAINYLNAYGKEPSVGSGWTYNPNTKMVYSQNLNLAPRTLEEHQKIQSMSAKEKEQARRDRWNAKRQEAARIRKTTKKVDPMTESVRKFLTSRTDMP